MLKYEHIAKQLNAFIHQSNFKPGDKLPNVTQLKERYQVSKSTIIKALGLLEQDGLIYQAQGQWYLCEKYCRCQSYQRL